MSEPNRHPADRIADIRAEIAALREEEAVLRNGFISGALPLEGDEHVVNVGRKMHVRIDVRELRKHVKPSVWQPFAIRAATNYVRVREK